MALPNSAERPAVARALGAVGGATGLGASLFVLFGPVASYARVTPDGTTTTGTVSGIDYLLGTPGADVALFAWPLLLGVVSVVGAVAVWRRQTRWTWAAALTVAVFAVLGGFSIGLLYAPAAALLLGAALFGREK